MPAPEAAEAGRVGRPHGLDGTFHVVHPLPALLVAGARVTVAGQAREIERRAGTDEKPIVRLSGCGSRVAAEALRGQPLLIAHVGLPGLAEGEYCAHEPQGRTVGGGERAVGV